MRKHAASRGQVLLFVALCMTVLIGYAGIAVDVAYWQYRLNVQQSATDAAATGGAQQLLYAGCPNQTVAQTSAIADSSSNGFANAGNTTVSVTNPPTGGPYAGLGCAVLVQITTTHNQVFFARFFGYPDGIPITTQAVASLSSNDTGCVYMLALGQQTNFSSSNVKAPQCSILLNGSANFDGSTVDAGGIGEVNYSGSNNSGTFTAATPSPMLPVSDPCPEIAGCEYLTTNPPSTSPCNMTYGGGGTMSQGCYNNLNLNNATVTMQPGLYVFAGSSNLHGATITGNGVTIYIPASAMTNFNSVAGLTLTAPTSGNYTGVTYYQVKTNTTVVNLNGSSTNVSGLIYAPTAAINYNGSQENYTILVGAYANINSAGGEDFSTPPPGVTPVVQRATLAQ